MNTSMKKLATGILAGVTLASGLLLPGQAEAASISAKFGQTVNVSNENAKIDSIIRTGKSLMNHKAQYSHNYRPPKYMDCSQFIYYIFGKNGINMQTRDDDRQVRLGEYVPKNKLRKGDLVFYNSNQGKRDVTHVGLYIGNGQVLHMSNPQDDVKISSLNSSWHKKYYLTARRVIN
ncbi:C40 family peptidase [Aneurinibacillus uraniidurans]|uniref:C40 family peptidase n=1 Tax=Aneurinibacillus uraniidurans TaxID=2966586 RepID=UPI00234A170F|nr:C40 family peptidase [Aneurinibacillus sp. B1]WCN37266.1 C40 family peptidase [Aneurinibacillus sp. B1]